MSVATGRCLCGAVRFEIDGEVGPASYCHCADCRRVTGSAFNISVRVRAADFRVLQGETGAFTKTGDSGNELTRHFCTQCGSPLFTTAPAHPDVVYVKAGTLDDPGLVEPTHQSWAGSTVSWAKIPPDLPAYEKARPGQPAG